MKIDNTNTRVVFEATPAEYFLVYNQSGVEYPWSLSHRIDMSYKGKDDQVGGVKFYLADEEAEACKKAGFEVWMASPKDETPRSL